MVLNNYIKRDRITRIIDRIILYPDDKHEQLIEMLPDELSFPGLSDQTLKDKVRIELDMHKRRNQQ